MFSNLRFCQVVHQFAHVLQPRGRPIPRRRDAGAVATPAQVAAKGQGVGGGDVASGDAAVGH